MRILVAQMKKVKEILKTYRINKTYKRDLENELAKELENVDHRKFLERELVQVMQIIEDVDKTISSLSQPNKSLIFYRYIKGMSYESIAFRLNYSVQRIYQLLNLALNEFLEKYINIQKEKIREEKD